MADNRLPAAIWQYVALTHHPDGKKITGEIEAQTLLEAIQLIEEKGLFPVEIKLPTKEKRQVVQTLAVAQSVIDYLEKKGMVAKGVQEGKIVILAEERAKRNK